MRSQIKLGRIFGIEIGLHYSWFLIALLIVFSLSSQFHTSNPQWGNRVILGLAVATAILFFVSLLLHELAHSIVASSNGLPVKEIPVAESATCLLKIPVSDNPVSRELSGLDYFQYGAAFIVLNANLRVTDRVGPR